MRTTTFSLTNQTGGNRPWAGHFFMWRSRAIFWIKNSLAPQEMVMTQGQGRPGLKYSMYFTRTLCHQFNYIDKHVRPKLDMKGTMSDYYTA